MINKITIAAGSLALLLLFLNLKTSFVLSGSLFVVMLIAWVVFLSLSAYQLFKIKLVRTLLFVGLCLFVLSVLAYLFVAQPNKIDGTSMEPNVADGKQVITNKLIYRWESPKRGDIIIFRHPLNEATDAISRIIAIPGDKIMVKEGNVILNGQNLTESYLKEQNSTTSGKYISEDSEVTLGSGEYFVMGDNRIHSSDSRDYGVVKIVQIVGKI